MAYEFGGKTIETTATGYLANHDDWSRELAEHIAGLEQITLTQRHWDLIEYLRDEYFNNNENMPNTRAILKAMSEKWNEKIDQGRSTTCFRSTRRSKADVSPACLKAAARADTEAESAYRDRCGMK